MSACTWIPPNRAGRRIIDQEKVCEAIESLGDPAEITTWARRFAVLADPTRLRLLLAIKAAGPISVTDLAVAAVSPTPPPPRPSATCAPAARSPPSATAGSRYQLHDPAISELLDYSTPYTPGPRQCAFRASRVGRARWNRNSKIFLIVDQYQLIAPPGRAGFR